MHAPTPHKSQGQRHVSVVTRDTPHPVTKARTLLALLLASALQAQAATIFVNGNTTIGNRDIAAADEVIVRSNATLTINGTLRVFGRLENRGTVVLITRMEVEPGGEVDNLNEMLNSGDIEVEAGASLSTRNSGIPGGPDAILSLDFTSTLTNRGILNVGSGAIPSGASLISDGQLFNENVINNYARIEQRMGTLSNAGGVIVNLGTLQNDSLLFNDALGDIENLGILVNTGQLTNADDAQLHDRGYADNTGFVLNQGFVLVDPEAELVNSGVFINEAEASLVIDGVLRNQSEGHLWNLGSVRNQAAATLDNLGLIENVSSDGAFGELRNFGDNALLRNRGTIENIDALIENDDGATLTNQSGLMVNSGVIATEALFQNLTPADIDNTNGAIFNYCDGSVRNDGSIDNSVGGTLFNAGGTITNNGNIIGPSFANGVCAHLN